MLAVPAFLLLAGCGGSAVGATNGLTVSPGSASIDTNCTGCNSTSTGGSAIEQFAATQNGGAANVTWTLSGGDANAGQGTISSTGQYTPPPYLTANSVQVTVTATLAGGSGAAKATLTITPGFLEPLAPENVALGAGQITTIKAFLAEAGGATGVNFALSSSATGSSGGQGTLVSSGCVRSPNAFTYCDAQYTAPGSVSSNAVTYVVATVGSSASTAATEVLLNTAGIDSNPTTHQTQLATPISLGSSGSNNNDYDTQDNQIVDCCGGTLGSLVQNSNGTQYLLSCNHVLARSDQASVGETIIQPGLIDNNCTPNGIGGGTTPVGVLSAWLPLSSSTTNADAAIAQVNSGAVSSSGAILELGTPQAGGTLAAAPPGVSSTGGKGENGTINMVVAKSGRTTGLTCGSIATVSLDVEVPYYKNCEETEPYITKVYTNQIEVEGNEFSDAGDSGSLVVDASDAEPVGLFFAGGVNNQGVTVGVANPAPSVLSELSAMEGTNYTFVGAADHPVSCLNYSAGTASISQGSTLSPAQNALAQQALGQARMLINPSAGILGAATGKSSDHAGEAAVILYVDQNMNVAAPQTIDGVRTEVIPTTAQAVAAGTTPQFPGQSGALPPLASSVLSQAISAKLQAEPNLMRPHSAFFGVGVGQSYDNPKEAALVIFVDRRQVPVALPAIVNGLRTRYIVMDRLHVTRSYLAAPIQRQSRCMPRAKAAQSNGFDLLPARTRRDLNLF